MGFGEAAAIVTSTFRAFARSNGRNASQVPRKAGMYGCNANRVRIALTKFHLYMYVRYLLLSFSIKNHSGGTVEISSLKRYTGWAYFDNLRPVSFRVCWTNLKITASCAGMSS